MKLLMIALGVAAIAAPAAAAPGACPTGLHPATTAELFFGRDVGAQMGVSDADWRRFVDQEVAPRFSSGLSVTDVYGQWRGPKGAFVREPSKALLLVISGTRDERADIGHIRDAYRRRFHQDLVPLVEQRACVSF